MWIKEMDMRERFGEPKVCANCKAMIPFHPCPYCLPTINSSTVNYMQVLGDPAAYISDECDSIKKLLLEKNTNYGNSVLAPKRIFSNSDSREQILVRIDDKLSRIEAGNGFEAGEDTVADLIGYLVMLRVHDQMQADNSRTISFDDCTYTSTEPSTGGWFGVDMAKEQCCNEGSDSCGRDGDKTSSSDKDNK
jgi:hypothetical protein